MTATATTAVRQWACPHSSTVNEAGVFVCRHCDQAPGRKVHEVIPTDARAKALVRFAELAILHDLPEKALPAIVFTLASPAVRSSAQERFEQLVDSVREQQSFNADPVSWADRHDRSCRSDVLDSIHDTLQADVEFCTWNLLHPAPVCRRCIRSRAVEDCNAAEWPESLDCAHHRDAS